jgi:hypothetical protein
MVATAKKGLLSRVAGAPIALVTGAGRVAGRALSGGGGVNGDAGERRGCRVLKGGPGGSCDAKDRRDGCKSAEVCLAVLCREGEASMAIWRCR